MKVRLSSRGEVYDYCKPYIIAELGSNHNGDMDLARRLVLEASKAGAHCVKFQSWSKETIFSRKVYEENRFLADDYRQRTDYTLEQIVDKFAITEAQLIEMKRLAEEAGLDMTSTPFSRREVDFLVEELGAGFIKVASMDLNNYPFLSYIASKGLPVVLSTGLSTLGEIDEAVMTIEAAGNRQIVLLHCVALYPPRDSQVNLRRMETLRRAYGYPVGYSDHCLGTHVPLAAAALGACIIEKHFTLDKGLFGWDHKVSADPVELRALVEGASAINAALGEARIKVEECPERLRAFRRSIVAARAIKAGEVFTEEMLDFKRPGEGLAPGEIKYVLGKPARRDLEPDQILSREDY